MLAQLAAASQMTNLQALLLASGIQSQLDMIFSH